MKPPATSVQAHRPTAIVFDVFGTIVDWRTSVAREAEPFLQRHLPGTDPLAFADAWRAEYQPAMTEVREGRRDFVPLDVLHRESAEKIVADFGGEPGGIDPAEFDELTLAWHRLDPWPDSVAALRRLKERYIIAPLSNGNVRLSIDLSKFGGLPWDAILGAEVVRAYKPTPESYLRTADMLMIEPSELMLVAAHNSDLAAARSAGLQTAFFPRPTEHGPEQTSDLAPEQDWEICATDIGALVDELT